MTASATATATGLGGLLNLHHPSHRTVVLHEGDLATGDRQRILQDLHPHPTQVHFVGVPPSPEELEAALRREGLDLASDFVSILLVGATRASRAVALGAFHAIPNAEFTRLELPPPEIGFAPEHVSHLLDVVGRADYAEQDAVADRFFDLLERRRPYDVVVRTRGAELRVRDDAPWYQLAGRLTTREERILPGGEVAYVGERIDGRVTLDGAILAIPEHPDAAPLATQLQPVGARLAGEPVTLTIVDGRITRCDAAESSAALRDLIATGTYAAITELGISFNRACDRFVHDWMAASNEGRPGVHVAVGGDPDPEERHAYEEPRVHVDLMAATTEVWVNDELFLRTS